MIKNYLLTAIRNLSKNKVFSAINILGLALGLVCSLFIYLWVDDERNMNKFHANSEQLYSVFKRVYSAGEIEANYFTPGVLAEEMKKVLPAVQLASSASQSREHTFQVNDKILKKDGLFAGADFLKMFSYTVLEGDRNTALNTPDDMAISKSMAEAFFGSSQLAMGKTVRFENRRDFRVTAVFDAQPKNSTSKFDYLINWEAFLADNNNMKSWGNHGVGTFVQLKKGTDPEVFAKQIKNFLNKYDPQEGDFKIEFGLQRYDDMYLNSKFDSQGQPEGGRIEYVRLFSIVAVFILLIACINFMNLTTARSVKRAREIGVRKVVGAVRASLIAQFIGEAILLVFISTLVALALVAVLLPVFNNITGKEIVFPVGKGPFWLIMAGVTITTGLVSGSYPALFLSSFNPVRILKGTMKLSGGNVVFRKGLVIFQFALSIMLIVGTIVVSKQVNYIKTKSLGFDRQNLIFVPQEGELNQKYTLFKTEALKMPGIGSISRTEQQPVNISSGTWGIDWEGKPAEMKPTFSYAGVGFDFVKTMNIQVLQGHDFRPGFAADSVGYILNEEAVKQIGYTDPVGRSFTMWGRKSTIVGVVKNFHFNSLHEPVKPMVLWLGDPGYNGNILVKTKPGQTTEALASLAKLSKELNPAFPFSYKFADTEYNTLYKSEQMIGVLSNCFAFLAIFISCLGLLGLAMFTAEQRIREIGIRKVLGASVIGITELLSKDFLVLVGISALIAFPVAWWAMNTWLQSFAYSISISWGVFAIAGLLTAFIALATINFQSVKAALMNPVRSLRAE
ncbi:ABC transporter permease [Daejeonella sp. JGW-45]|uniref:ABC transporter permease n=1 Tax=Daejeonella sp. JGW-45 TaxID=3034148 RepID=UPI0023EB16D9|nr:ABC transporter permease [Daejeonella sp. JGW-45]